MDGITPTHTQTAPAAIPFHLARAYGVAGRPAVAPPPRVAPLSTPAAPAETTAPRRVDVVDITASAERLPADLGPLAFVGPQTGRPQAATNPRIEALVAARVDVQPYDVAPARRAAAAAGPDAALPFYRNPTERNAAATGVAVGALGTTVDVRG